MRGASATARTRRGACPILCGVWSWRPGVLATVLVSGFLDSSPASAAERGWRFAWEVPSACPSGAELERRIGALLGTPSTEWPIQVMGAIRREREGFRLDMVARRGSARQQRTLWHRECALLGEAAALLVALAIDPSAAAIDPEMASLLRSSRERESKLVRRQQPPSQRASPVSRDYLAVLSVAPPDDASSLGGGVPPPSQGETEKADERGSKPPEEPSVLKTSKRPRIDRWLALRAAGGIAYGLESAVSPGLSGTAALALGRYGRVELGGSYWPISVGRDPDGRGGGADITLAAGSARGCGVPAVGIIEVPLCAGVELGSVRVTGPGIPEGRGDGQLWSAVSLGAALAVVPLPLLAIWLAADSSIALKRPSFRISPTGEDWRAGAYDLRVTLGVEVRFRKRRR